MQLPAKSFDESYYLPGTVRIIAALYNDISLAITNMCTLKSVGLGHLPESHLDKRPIKLYFACMGFPMIGSTSNATQVDTYQDKHRQRAPMSLRSPTRAHSNDISTFKTHAAKVNRRYNDQGNLKQ